MARVPLPIPEVAPDFPREWLTFMDPGDSTHQVRVDVTWLLSKWTCIFGRGCHGVTPGRAVDGCCSHGAFYSDKGDEKRTKSFAKQLTAETWQYFAEGKGGKDISVDDEAHGEARRKTRVVDGACIFLNREDFPTGAGCALHQLALREGLEPLETKPDVCWQLPVWRDEENTTTADEREIRTTIITEFDRRQWGTGGEDLNWYCTGSAEAHIGPRPMYVSYEPELVELLGRSAYDELSRLLTLRSESPLTSIHPATAMAETIAAKAARKAAAKPRKSST